MARSESPVELVTLAFEQLYGALAEEHAQVRLSAVQVRVGVAVRTCPRVAVNAVRVWTGR